MTIVSKPPTGAYRQSWERVFKKHEDSTEDYITKEVWLHYLPASPGLVPGDSFSVSKDKHPEYKIRTYRVSVLQPKNRCTAEFPESLVVDGITFIQLPEAYDLHSGRSSRHYLESPGV